MYSLTAAQRSDLTYYWINENILQIATEDNRAKYLFKLLDLIDCIETSTSRLLLCNGFTGST